MNWYVEIIEFDSEKVVKRMGPMSERQAERVAGGASINLNHDAFFIVVVNDDEKGDEA